MRMLMKCYVLIVNNMPCAQKKSSIFLRLRMRTRGKPVWPVRNLSDSSNFLDDRRIKESTGREQRLLSLPLFSGKIEGDSACRVHPPTWYNSLWLWKWLPNRLSKRQSVTTITDRNTFNRTIQFNLLLIMILIMMKSLSKISYWNHVGNNKICHLTPSPPSLHYGREKKIL